MPLDTEGELNLSHLSSERSRVFIVEEYSQRSKSIFVNNEEINVMDMPKEDYDKQKMDFFYGYASSLIIMVNV